MSLREENPNLISVSILNTFNEVAKPPFFMSPQKNIALVSNPRAGNGNALKVADKISIILKQQNVTHSIFTTYWPQLWDQFTEAWIVGGDGTLNFFINQYPDIKLPLSIFAGGTGNDFQWMLYKYLSIEKQVEKVLNAEPQLIDAGICNGKLFLNGVGVGFDGAVVKEVTGRKKSTGKSVYFFAVLKKIFSYKEQIITIETTMEKFSEDVLMISIANAQRYGGGFHVAPEAELHDGLLDVIIVRKISLLQRLKYLPVIEKGKHLHLPFIKYFKTGSVQITSPQIMHAHMDGEYLAADKFEIKILPERFSFMW